MPESRTSILQRFREKIAAGKPIIGGGAGTGISAKFEDAGGIDLIVIYNSGRFRMAGHGSPRRAHALLRRQRHRHGNGLRSPPRRQENPRPRRRLRHRPPCASWTASSSRSKRAGFAGVQNFPHRRPHRWRVPRQPPGNQHGLRPRGRNDPPRPPDGPPHHRPYVFKSDEAAQMAEAGADIIVAHMGLTTQKAPSGAHPRKNTRTMRPRHRRTRRRRPLRPRRRHHPLPTAAPSPNPTTPGSSSRTANKSTASTAPAPWNASPLNALSKNKPNVSPKSPGNGGILPPTRITTVASCCRLV